MKVFSKNFLKHVVVISLNFQPHRSTGDKNFWVELIPFLAKKLQRITVLSVRHSQQKHEEYKVNECHITVRYYSPRFLETPDAEYKRPRIFWRKGAFPSSLGVMEKMLNITRICNELKRLYRENPYNHVHLTDNFGPGNRLIATRVPTGASVSAMAYQGKNRLLYDRYLTFSYDSPNLTVVSYSTAFAKKLRQIGVDKKRIVRIRWGVQLPPRNPTTKDRKKFKLALSLPIDKPLLVWSGYISQIQKKDFLYAYEIAEQSLKKGLNGVFYFAFKPESFEKKFTSFHNSGKGIYVAATTTQKFNLLQHCADILYSRVVNNHCILAPPLTWIEFLSLGVPILTTHVPGANEIVSNGKTGYLTNSQEELIEKLFTITKRYEEMIPYCWEKVHASYNIKRSAKQYLNLWFPGEGEEI